MKIAKICEKFKLAQLDQSWVKSVEEFIDFRDPDDEYLIFIEREMSNLLHEMRKAIKQWLRSEDSNCEGEESNISWRMLKSEGIDSDALLAVLGFIIKTGQKLGANEDSRQLCFRATSLYFTLLSIPGSSAYRIFHSNLFQLAIETLKLTELLLAVTKKADKTPTITDLYNNAERGGTLSKQEKDSLTIGLNSVMFDLIWMLKSFPLKDHSRCVDYTIQILVEITKAETTVNHFESCVKSSNPTVTSLSYNAYMALMRLCSPNHGDVEMTIKRIAKYILRQLLFVNSEMTHRSQVVVRETTISFLKKSILEEHSADAESGIAMLVQHLMSKCPANQDARKKQAEVIVRIIGICRGSLFLKVMTDLIYFCHNTKALFRNFGQEIMCKLLFELSKSSTGWEEEDFQVKERAMKVLVATILTRCNDDANMVRGKAIAILSEIVDPCKRSLGGAMIRVIFESEDSNKPLPILDQLQEALTDDSDPFPGWDPLFSMLMARTDDERAFVRRNALNILRNLADCRPEVLQKVAPVVGARCRDPSLVVRAIAIQVLTELLQNHPEDDSLLDEWITCVVQQFDDVEIKIGDEILKSMQSLILDRILRDDPTHLAWKVVNRLVERKMRECLSKACMKWSNSGVLNNNIVGKIRSFIGTEFDIQAWVLLTAISEVVTLKNMSQYFQHYRDIIESEEMLSHLKLEVLKNCWMTFNQELMQGLKSQLYQSLCHFKVSVEVIGTCIDIFNDILKFLQSNDQRDLLSNMLNLMRLSEAKIDMIFNEEENPADVSPTRVMYTLKHASLYCTGNVSSSTLDILQGILLQPESLSENLRQQQELQSFGVILLGGLAMRDREIAIKITPILACLMCSDQDTNAPAAIRVNAIKALADLCQRFTALVEPYLPKMCACMRDSDIEVREAIVVIFIQLLLEDFIQVKGPFFFHILTMLSDSDASIRELTIFLIKERLLAKNKTLISQQFVRSMFYYNDCKFFKSARSKEGDTNLPMLPGLDNQNNRRKIYDFMLDYLDPTARAKLLGQLSKQVFGNFSKGDIPLENPDAQNVLKDAMYIVSSDFMQTSTWTNKPNDDEMQEEVAPAPTTPHNNVINAAIDNVKKFKLQNLLPSLVRLQTKLRAVNPSLLKNVVTFFVNVASEFNKEQLSGLFSEYPKLEQQIDEEISKRGKKRQSEDEDPRIRSLPQKITRVVLERLSPEMISHLSNSKKNEQSARLEKLHFLSNLSDINSASSSSGASPRSRSTSLSSALEASILSTPEPHFSASSPKFD